MFNISLTRCTKRYIGQKSLENQTVSGRNGCLIPSYSVTQPSDLGFWISRSSIVFILFLVECNQDKKVCNYLMVYNQDKKRTILSCIYFFYHLPKIKVPLQATQKSLFLGPLSSSLTSQLGIERMHERRSNSINVNQPSRKLVST